MTVSDIYLSKEVEKSRAYSHLVPKGGAHSILTVINKHVHKQRRKVLMQGFSDQALRAFEPTILSHVDIFVANLWGLPINEKSDGGWSAPVDMSTTCKYLSYDIMGEFGFGQSLNLQIQPENRFLVKAVAAASRKAIIQTQYPWLAAWLAKLKLKPQALLGKKLATMRSKFMVLTSELVKLRLRAEGQARNDLISFIINAKTDKAGEALTVNEIKEESRFLLIAGKEA